MKRSIPFEFFAPNQHMYFDLKRLADMERELGTSIIRIAMNIEEATCEIGFITAACRIGLAHHYSGKPGVMEDVLDKYLEDGGSLFDGEFLLSINRALIASGLFGKEMADKAVRNELGSDDETEPAVDEKNAQEPAGE